MLEALGLSEIDEQVYVALLGRPHMAASEVAEELGRGVGVVRAAVTRLEELGFVARLPGSPTRLTATRPEVAVGALVARRTEELSDAAQAAQQLSASFPKEVRARPDELVEIIVGRSAVAARFVQLTRAVQVDLLVLDRPPYAQNADGEQLLGDRRPEQGRRRPRDLCAGGVRAGECLRPGGGGLAGRGGGPGAWRRADEAGHRGPLGGIAAAGHRRGRRLGARHPGADDRVGAGAAVRAAVGTGLAAARSGTAAPPRTPPTRSTTSCSRCSRRGSRTRRSPASSASASAPWAGGSGGCSTRSEPAPASRPASKRAAPGCAADAPRLRP